MQPSQKNVELKPFDNIGSIPDKLSTMITQVNPHQKSPFINGFVTPQAKQHHINAIYF